MLQPKNAAVKVEEYQHISLYDIRIWMSSIIMELESRDEDHRYSDTEHILLYYIQHMAVKRNNGANPTVILISEGFSYLK